MIKKLNKRLISFMVAFAMMFTNFFGLSGIGMVYGQATKAQDTKEVEYTVNDAVEALKLQLKNKKELTGWEVVAAKKLGLNLSEFKIDKETESFKKDNSSLEAKAEQSIILMELGEKPEKLIQEIADSVNNRIKNNKTVKVTAHEVNGILAIDKYNEIYKNEKIKYDENAINYVIAKCSNNGSIFSAAVNTASSMELIFKHKEDLTSHKDLQEKINKAEKFIQGQIKENGAIYGYAFNINQQADIVQSLVNAGQNLKDKNWVKDGKTPIDGLFKGWNGKEYVECKEENDTVGRVLRTLITLKENGCADYVLKGVKFDGYTKSKENKEDNKEKAYTVNDAVKVFVDYYEKDFYHKKRKTLQGFQAAAMKKAGADLSKWTIDKETDSFKKSWCSLAAKAETSMIIMDFGENPAKYKERNLIKEIADDLDKVSSDKNFWRNEVKALIAIDRYNEKFKDNKVDYKVEKAVNHLLKNQKEDGSFYDTPQTTAKAMNALLRHKDIKGVNEAIDKARNYVKSYQKDGGKIYINKFFTNIQVDAVNYLIGAGEDLTSDEWTKDGKTPIEGLFGLWDGKKFVKDTTPDDDYSIDKVLYALASLKEKGHGDYVLKGVKFHEVKPEQEKTCKVNVSIVYTNKDGKRDVKFAPQEVCINNKNPKHYGKFTVLGALQAATDNYKEKDGYVSSIFGMEAKGYDGWMYTLNGKIPETYANETPIKEGDKVVWYYANYDAKTKKWTEAPTWDELIKSDDKQESYNVNDAIAVVKSQLEKKKELKGWEVVAAKKAGLDFSKFKTDKETENFKQNKKDISNKAEQSIILMELGEKPEVLVKEIAEELNKYIKESQIIRYPADSVRAMYAVDKYNEIFKDDKIEYDYKNAVKTILNKQDKDKGGIAYSEITTSLGLSIFLNHKDVEGVDKGIQLGLKYINDTMRDDGGVYTYSFNVYSQAELVYILSKTNIDIKKNFSTKQEKTIIDGLFVAWNGKTYDEKFNNNNVITRDEALGEVLNALASLKEKGHGDYVLKGVKFDGYKKEDPQEKPEEKVDEKSVDGLINKVLDYYSKDYFYERNGQLEGWQYGTLVRSKADLSKNKWYFQEKYVTNQDRNLNLIGTKINQSLMLLDRGKDPNNFDGRHLINEIAEYLDKYNERFTFIDIQGVIALDRYNKKFSDKQVKYNEKHAIEKILESQASNGGFKEREEGIVPCNTGKALIALNSHRDIKGVDEAIKNAIKYLHDVQKPDGGFYVKTFITGYHAEALQGLIAVGENPTSNEWTTKEGKNPIDALFKLYKSNSSFDNMANESIHNRGWWEGTWKALYTLVDVKEAGYGQYQPKGVGDYKGEVDEVQKKCKVNVAIVLPVGDGTFDCLVGPKQVEIDNKKHLGGITPLGALQASTSLYQVEGGMVSAICGRENKGNKGWTYLVNDVMPDVLANQYTLKDGDNVVWYYSMNGMKDKNPKWEQLSKTDNSQTLVQENIRKSAEFIARKDKLDYFDVIALRSISKKEYENVFKKYIQDVEKNIKNKDGSLFNEKGEIKYLECAKAIMGLTAAGKDARDVSGMDLIEELCKKDKMDESKIENIAYTLLALDSGKYEIPKNSDLTRDNLVKMLLDKSRKGTGTYGTGGWHNNKNASELDKPLTGIVIAALSPYKNNKNVKVEIDNAVKTLSEIQSGEDAGFSQSIKMGVISKYSEFSSKIAIGLCLNKVDPTSKEFTKKETNLLQFILNHATKDGFSKELGKETDGLSTAYALQALTSYKNLKENKDLSYIFEDFSGKPEEKPTEKDYSKEVKEAIEISANYILKLNEEDFNSWHAASLRSASKEVPTKYIEKVEKAIKGRDKELFKDGEIKDTECAKIIMAVTAAGKDARNIAGFNLIEHLCKEGKINKNDIYSLTYALIALDCGKYQIPSDSKLTRDELIKEIISISIEDDTWAEIDADTTGMILTALAPYSHKEEVKNTIDKAIRRLSEIQKQNGGFSFNYKDETQESCESAAQVIIGLCSNGINPTSKEFTKNGKNVIDSLLSFKTQDGFSHSKDGKTNKIATYQALQALSAYYNLMNKKQGIYDFEDFSSEINPEGKIKIENLTKEKEFKLGKDAKVTVNAINTGKEEKNVTLIVALYDKDGKFVNYVSGGQTLKSGQEVKLKSMLKLPSQGEYTIKAFVWDDFDKMTPFSDVIVIPVVK